jgi:hypothetical protein
MSLVLATHLIAPLAMAQSTSATLSTADATSTLDAEKLLKNKKFAEDREITDAKLRADAGSVSRYSLKFNLAYYGPIVNDLSAQDQPNPDGVAGTYETAIAGSLGGRFRIDPAHSISLGSGLKAIHPFGDMDRIDLSNPFLSFDSMNRVGNLQMRNSPGISAITIPNYTKLGEYGSVSYDFSSVYNFGTSPWAVGLDANVGLFLYKRGYETADKKATSYNISAAPNVKYNFSDKFSVNSSVQFSWMNPRQTTDRYTLWNKTASQRVGLGYAYTRDIYIAPYLNLFPTRLALDTTTINIATIFSVL